ncbi:MAG: DUF3798 domain-containing protein [Defluviitaleaceae bacterium]|nr:DUF3798 domain-containing protein [Defluviitaleaceae bacterium]
MLKKLLVLSLLSLAIIVFAACFGESPAPAPADPEPNPVAEADVDPIDDTASADEALADDVTEEPAFVETWRVGIITGSLEQSPEEYLAARRLEERFPNIVIRTTYPDNFGAEMQTTIDNVQALANAGARAIVINEAVPGTITAIQNTRQVFDDDIFFFVGSTHEPPAEVARHADIAMTTDSISMGHAIMQQANAMGADTFVHISFPRQLGMANVAQQHELLQQTAQALDIEWIDITAPDPMTEGVTTAQTFIMENIPLLVAQHGPNTAFFSTSCEMQEALITQIAEHGGLFPSQCHPNPFHAFPAAFDISMEGNEGDASFIINQTRIAIAQAGGTGRFSTWHVSMNMALIEIGVLYSIEYLEENIERHDRDALRRIINEVATTHNTTFQVTNWPLDDDTFIDNFYMILADFVNF